MRLIRNFFLMLASVAMMLVAGCTFQEDIIGAPGPSVDSGTVVAFPAASSATEENPKPSPTATITEAPIPDASPEPISSENPEALLVYEDECYDTKDEVALYIYLYEHLPANYMTKKEARAQGWGGGALHLVVEGMCIGGDRFGNNEGSLPDVSGRKYYECDINTLNSTKRGSERIIYSNDGQIYYTGDHYETFDLLYGDEE